MYFERMSLNAQVDLFLEAGMDAAGFENKVRIDVVIRLVIGLVYDVAEGISAKIDPVKAQYCIL